MAELARIEERIDRVAVGGMEVSDALGGIRFQNMIEVMEFAKCMAIAETAVPKHLRGNVGMCLAVCIQALEWRFSPFAVANKSYVVNDRIGYESQLVHAVIEQRAPIIGRLRHRFEGEGDDRRCIVSATLRENNENLEYISPAFSKIQPKNSPLWKTKPDLQLYYNTSRDFCRAYFPDVLLGVYSSDELRDHVGPENAKDVTDKPGVASRLKGGKGRGFNAQHVERETARGVIDETPAPTEASPSPDSNSPQDSQPPSPQGPDAEPAPATGEQASVGAGEPTSLAASVEQLHTGEERQGTESGASALHGSAALPEGDRFALETGWEKSYAEALARASKPVQLPKRATEWWADKGGWAHHKNGENAGTAQAIYDAFANHFGDAGKEAREVILHELGAA